MSKKRWLKRVPIWEGFEKNIIQYSNVRDMLKNER